MCRINATQIKAARAILGWSQENLAQHTKLSTTTVRKLEVGFVSPRRSTNMSIRCTIEKAGIEFLDSEGVRRRLDDIVIYRGTDSCDKLFHDIMLTATETDGEVFALMPSLTFLQQSLGIIGKQNATRLHELCRVARVKCLTAKPECVTPQLIQTRTSYNERPTPMSYFVYGNRHVIIQQECDKSFSFVIYKAAHIAYIYRKHFHELWSDAVPISDQVITEGQI